MGAFRRFPRRGRVSGVVGSNALPTTPRLSAREVPVLSQRTYAYGDLGRRVVADGDRPARQATTAHAEGLDERTGTELRPREEVSFGKLAGSGLGSLRAPA